MKLLKTLSHARGYLALVLVLSFVLSACAPTVAVPAEGSTPAADAAATEPAAAEDDGAESVLRFV